MSHIQTLLIYIEYSQDNIAQMIFKTEKNLIKVQHQRQAEGPE